MLPLSLTSTMEEVPPPAPWPPTATERAFCSAPARDTEAPPAPPPPPRDWARMAEALSPCVTRRPAAATHGLGELAVGEGAMGEDVAGLGQVDGGGRGPRPAGATGGEAPLEALAAGQGDAEVPVAAAPAHRLGHDADAVVAEGQHAA